jgi:hypothetical protein
VTSPHAGNGAGPALNGHEAGKRADPEAPTAYAPGSKEKIELMAERLRRGIGLFIRGDNPVLSRRPTSTGPRQGEGG